MLFKKDLNFNYLAIDFRVIWYILTSNLRMKILTINNNTNNTLESLPGTRHCLKNFKGN